MRFPSNAIRLGKFLAFAVLLVLVSGAHRAAQAAPTYICVGVCTPIIITDPTAPPPQQGSLVNILGIAIDGALYDVAFVDGRFIDIFGATPTLAFTTGTQAQRAAQALNDTLIDVGMEYFDSDPGLTRGCFWDQACLIVTPFSLATEVAPGIFRYVEFVNDNPFLGLVAADSVGSATGTLDSIYSDYRESNDHTFAVWRLAGSTGATDPFFTAPTYDSISVPEPGVLALLCVGLVGLATTRRRREQK